MIGRVIGQFRIEEELGAGAMGVVYRARDERLRRDVALKFLPPGTLASQSSRNSFHREALALSRLNHPCIATVHDFQTADGLDFLVMEYIPGESLDQKVAQGPLPESEAIALGIQLAEGLAAAHHKGVIHRDLKPANLRVTPEGRLKILDFGLAQWRAGETLSLPDATATNSASFAGTPAFMAPEVLRGGPATERSDLFAAGVVLYQLTTGSLPFPGLPVGALLEAIVTRTPPPPRSRNPAISPGIEAVIGRCMEREPEGRFASADELCEALRRPGGAEGKPWPWRKWRAPLAAAAMVAIVLGVTLGFVAWRRGELAGRAPAPTLRSLAVLPLGNLSGDPEQDYFADGMTEELISQLASVHSIRVISLTSVMRYRSARPAMSEIGRELGVDGVIEGNVLKSRDRLRTTVHLIAAREDEQLWSGQYDGDTTDALGLQNRVARAIVHEIQVRLSPAERARLHQARRTDPVAYQLYLRGRYQWNRRSDASIRLAIDYFQQAIQQDSLYAQAHAGLSDAWDAAGLYGLVPPRVARERARPEALLAVSLDPGLADAHASLGNVLQNMDWDWDAAEQEYLRAIALQPSNAVAHHWYAHLLAQQGRMPEARAQLQMALELDPLAQPIVLAAGVFEYYDRHYELALDKLQRAAELDSTNSLLHRVRAGVLDRLGREREAVREVARSIELRGDPATAAALIHAYDAGGARGALGLMVQGLIRKRGLGAYEPAEHVAELYSRLGEVDEAIRWLEIAYGEHDTELNRLKMDPLFDPLRSDPRFQDLLMRVGLARAPSRS